MKVRSSFVSNSSVSSFVTDGEGLRVAKQIIKDLEKYNLSDEDKEKFEKKWAELVQDVDTWGEYDG